MTRMFVISLLILMVAVSRESNALSFQPIHFPGSNSTMPMSIDGNTIVGQYCDDTTCAAFVFDGSTYSKFELPDVDVFGLNGVDGDNVVGLLYDPVQREQRTFWYDGSTLTLVGTTISDALAIDDGVVVGVQNLVIDGEQGFIFDGMDYQNVTHPSIVPAPYTPGTVFLDVDDGLVLGAYETSSAHWQSFVYDGTSFVDLPIPVTSPYIPARGIDGNRIVGRLNDMGFYFDGSMMTEFSHPDAVNGTVAKAISGVSIIGWYIDAAGREHGYLLIIPEPETAVLGLLGLAAAIIAGGRGRHWPNLAVHRTFTG